MGIKNLILQGEGVCLDFKKTITSAEKIAKSLVAFANNKGGKLLIGVADDKSIVGVKAEDEERYMILKAAHQFCKPAIEPIFDEIYVDNKLVLVVNILESDTKPHYALDDQKKWWAYIRIQDKSVLASRIILEVLKQDQKDTGVLISYSESEKKLLQYLDLNGKITLKQLSKLLRCSYKKGQQILVNLILTDVIKSHTSEKEEYFIAV
ncbi:ATP-binding protein [Pedobacter changchengzhani]|uniref:ATP-binding protein n=1 Tax=Pedobacter changchengzhani TaxID=2529274 RepID=A0A4R5MJ31_9SPHI|nr:ATP-binding protein [Pedobacter changchengzhani]TDG35647.1 ATP-binding protein [Pedobacter changchengzhani]